MEDNILKLEIGKRYFLRNGEINKDQLNKFLDSK